MSDNDPVANPSGGWSSLDRRRFLSVLGMGAAGTVAAKEAMASRESGPAAEAPPDTEVERPTGGTQQIVWSAPIKEPVAALTFDDGPDPEFTPVILDILESAGVVATFFAMGHNAVTHPELLRRVVAAGHEVGGHGWQHLDLSKVADADAVMEIDHGIREIERVTGAPIRLFRPPYGRVGEAAIRLLGHAQKDVIVWSVTRGDLGWRDPQQIAAHVSEALAPGAIVDLHDGIGRGTFERSSAHATRLRRRRHTEVRALPAIIEGGQKRGLRWATVSELLYAGKGADSIQ